ncbi:MAG: hypothetical protein HKM05_08350 [Spirochaetales bacterium]|nr:hypothetical protein [Spirochaetales bacterium]
MKALATGFCLLTFLATLAQPLIAEKTNTSELPSELYPNKFDMAVYAGQWIPWATGPDWDQRLGFEGAWRYQFTTQVSWGISAGLQALYSPTAPWPVLWEGWGQIYWDWIFLKPFSLRFMSGALGGPSTSAPYLGADVGYGPLFVETKVLLATVTVCQISLGWRWKGL